MNPVVGKPKIPVCDRWKIKQLIRINSSLKTGYDTVALIVNNETQRNAVLGAIMESGISLHANHNIEAIKTPEGPGYLLIQLDSALIENLEEHAEVIKIDDPKAMFLVPELIARGKTSEEITEGVKRFSKRADEEMSWMQLKQELNIPTRQRSR